MAKKTDDYSALGRAPVKRRENPWANVSGDIPSVEEVNISSIEFGDNPRTVFDSDSITELAANIESTGLLQPIVVQRRLGKIYLIAGERRCRAFKLLKRKTIPAIVIGVDKLSPDKAPLARIAENLQRVDLSPGELALSVQALVDEGWSQVDVAKELGKSKAWVSKKVSHAKLCSEFKEASLIETETASEIARLPETERKAAIEKAVSGSSFVRESVRKSRKQNSSGALSVDEEIEKLTKEKQKLQTKIRAIDERLHQLKNPM